MQGAVEDFTLNLSDEVNDILTYFNVIIEGTQEKRTAKRTRLVKHFSRQFYKFIKLEKEWIFPGDKDKSKNASALGITDKQKYEMTIARKEKALLKDLELMGIESIEAMKKIIEYKVLAKLIDREEEEIQMELLQAKGIALAELLQSQGPSSEVLDF